MRIPGQCHRWVCTRQAPWGKPEVSWGILAPSLMHTLFKHSPQNPTPRPALEQQVKTKIPDNTEKVGGCHKLPAASVKVSGIKLKYKTQLVPSGKQRKRSTGFLLSRELPDSRR